MWTCNKCREKIEDRFDSCWRCAGPADKIGLPFGVRLTDPGHRIARGILWAVGLVPTTWIFFGPIAGFHHMYGFGMTFYLVLNGEDPQPGDHMWGEFAVRFFPGRFAVGLMLWLISVFIVFRFVRFFTKGRYVA